eukprot:CAMPEP_0202865636 /NCGR_PEP_ID=MMETSP1391-20130828/6269_1 /ASSEMBLY_ACC=CAM_ASM_000867 /TAXON_ID=1034604 /ORGANISM="Chlamydomonas leiostraca, Strain SAG 11-49" /LENGTH=331 /DNA_ID=CAMNT_0049545499 /DNA_START=9 /DNA_END=1004 /DNA_ORIENTATION=-
MSVASCSGRVAPFTAHGAQARRLVVARVGRGMGMPPGGGGGGMPEVNHDPEGMFKGVPVQEGLIQRRMMQKQIEVDKEFAKAMKEASNELRKEALLRRETRRAPETDEELVEYFLNTLAEDMEYEVARYRPRLTPTFFKYLDGVLGAERFSDARDEDKLAELDLLRKYLGEASEAVDKCVQATASAADRMKKLLTAKDKKAMILDMAAANEIDQPLMDLLQQNIDAAKAAEQEDAAKFMEKVKTACGKYLITAAAPVTAMPAAPPVLGATQSAGQGSLLVTPAGAKTAAPAPAAPADGASKLIVPGSGAGAAPPQKLPRNPNAPPPSKLFI